MKKTLTALAVLGAFAGSAMAADVTLYGKVDAGLNYQNVEVDSVSADRAQDKDTFGMKSGQNSGSRFGIKGTEDLGNGMKVGFQLENGFDSDTGKMGQSNRLFGRQATLFVNGGFGEVAFGRVGALASGLGSYSSVYNHTATGTGWGDYAGAKGQFGLARDRMDNTITYKTPEFAGVTVLAQYSFQMDGKDAAENPDSGKNDRYAALGVNYKLGAFSADLVIDSVMPTNDRTVRTKATEDSLGVSLGASYDFGFMKLMGMAQYGKNDVFGDFNGGKGDAQDEGVEGYRLALGATAPVAGGTLLAQVNYLDAEDEVVSDRARTGYGLFAGYEYPLSARTKVYGFAAYNAFDDDYVSNNVVVTDDIKQTEFGFGMVHNF